MTELMKRYEEETCNTKCLGLREYYIGYMDWLEAQLRWRPVSEKPEMGQRVLYFGGTVEIGKYNRYEEWIDTDGGICPVEFTSHWLPIPPAPEEEEE